MAKRKNTTNPSASEPVYRIAHLFRDPVLRAVFAAAEKDDGAALALPKPTPRTLDGGAARRVLETA